MLSPEVYAIGGTNREIMYRRAAHATDRRASQKSDVSALSVLHQQPGTILVAGSAHFPEDYATGGADRETAHRREAHATGCCAAPSSWSVGDRESEPLDSSLSSSLPSSVSTGGKDNDGVVARSARCCTPKIVASVVTRLKSLDGYVDFFADRSGDQAFARPGPVASSESSSVRMSGS